jgi:hypothetical protein
MATGGHRTHQQGRVVADQHQVPGRIKVRKVADHRFVAQQTRWHALAAQARNSGRGRRHRSRRHKAEQHLGAWHGRRHRWCRHHGCCGQRIEGWRPGIGRLGLPQLGREVPPQAFEGRAKGVGDDARAHVDVQRPRGVCRVVEGQPELFATGQQLLPGRAAADALDGRFGKGNDVQPLAQALLAKQRLEVGQFLQAPGALRVVLVHHDDHRERGGHALLQLVAQQAGNRAVVAREVHARHTLAPQQCAQPAFQFGAEATHPAIPRLVVGVRIADEGGVFEILQGRHAADQRRGRAGVRRMLGAALPLVKL